MVEGRTHRPVISTEQCHACNVCLRGCPARLIPEYREGTPYPSSEERIPLPPCQGACPIHQDTKGYVNLIAKGRFKEALEAIREVNPMPAVCGFICHHLCEEACLRTEVDAPVPLRLLKRFVAEYERRGGRTPRRPKKRRRARILVVGSGPAGLAAANDLSLLGYPVTLLEALPLLGGMLAIGIPEFRLPRDVLKVEIESIRELGVEMETNRRFRVDRSEKDVQDLGFKAAFFSVGAHRSVKLEVEGRRLSGVLPGLEFLKGMHLGRKASVGSRVVVIGGGNVAVDVSRSAWRLGAREVHMACVESKKEMPAIPEEVDEAVREGVQIHTLAAPVRIVGKGGKVIGVDFRRRDRTFRILADTVLTAIGQKVDKDSSKGFDTLPDGRIRIDPGTGATSMKGVFAGGDVVTGPAWAIDAIAAGKRGAESIHRYLS